MDKRKIELARLFKSLIVISYVLGAIHLHSRTYLDLGLIDYPVNHYLMVGSMILAWLSVIISISFAVSLLVRRYVSRKKPIRISLYLAFVIALTYIAGHTGYFIVKWTSILVLGIYPSVVQYSGYILSEDNEIKSKESKWIVTACFAIFIALSFLYMIKNDEINITDRSAVIEFYDSEIFETTVISKGDGFVICREANGKYLKINIVDIKAIHY